MLLVATPAVTFVILIHAAVVPLDVVIFVIVVVISAAVVVAVEVVVVPPAVGRSAGRLWQLGRAAHSRACRRPQSSLKKIDQLHICMFL